MTYNQLEKLELHGFSDAKLQGLYLLEIDF